MEKAPPSVDARAADKRESILPVLQARGGKVSTNSWEKPNSAPSHNYSAPPSAPKKTVPVVQHDAYVPTPTVPKGPTKASAPVVVDARAADRMTTVLPALQAKGGKVDTSKWENSGQNQNANKQNNVGKLNVNWNPNTDYELNLNEVGKIHLDQAPNEGPHGNDSNPLKLGVGSSNSSSKDVGKLKNSPSDQSSSPNQVGKLKFNEPVSPDVGEFSNNPKPIHVDARACDRNTTILSALQQGKLNPNKWDPSQHGDGSGSSNNDVGKLSKGWNPQDSYNHPDQNQVGKLHINEPVSPDVGEFSNNPKPVHVDARACDRNTTILSALQQGKLNPNKWDSSQHGDGSGGAPNNDVGKLSKGWNPQDSYNHPDQNQVGKLHINEPVSPDVGEFTNNPKPIHVDARACDRNTTILSALQQGKLNPNKWDSSQHGDGSGGAPNNDVGKLSKGWNPQDSYNHPDQNQVGKLHINEPVSPDVGEFSNNPKPVHVDARACDRNTTILSALQQGKLNPNKWDPSQHGDGNGGAPNNNNPVGKQSKGWNPQDSYNHPDQNQVGKLHINEPVSPDVGEFTNNPKPSHVDARASERNTTVLPALQQGKINPNKWDQSQHGDGSSGAPHSSNNNDAGNLSKGFNPQDNTKSAPTYGQVGKIPNSNNNTNSNGAGGAGGSPHHGSGDKAPASIGKKPNSESVIVSNYNNPYSSSKSVHGVSNLDSPQYYVVDETSSEPDNYKMVPPTTNYDYGYDTTPYKPQYQQQQQQQYYGNPNSGSNNNPNSGSGGSSGGVVVAVPPPPPKKQTKPAVNTPEVKMSDFGRSGVDNKNSYPNYNNNREYRPNNNNPSEVHNPGYDIVSTTTTVVTPGTPGTYIPPPPPRQIVKEAPPPPKPKKVTTEVVDKSKYTIQKGVKFADKEEDTSLKDKILDFFDTSGNKDCCSKCGRKKTGRERFCPNDGTLYN